MIAALGALLASPGMAQAADLVTSSASTQHYGHPGGQIGATAQVKARSAVRAASLLRFYLSTDRTWDSKDVRLAGSATVPRLKAGRRHKGDAGKAQAVLLASRRTGQLVRQIAHAKDDAGRPERRLSSG